MENKTMGPARNLHPQTAEEPRRTQMNEYFGFYEEMDAYEGWQEVNEESGQTSGQEN